MVYNIIKTVKAGNFVKDEAAEAAPLLNVQPKRQKGEGYHRWLERKPIQFMIWALVAILIGGAIEIIPTYLIKSNIPTIESVKPCFYANRTTLSHLRVQARRSSNSAVTIEEGLNQFGKTIKTVHFLGIPVRLQDVLTVAESRVV